MNRKLLDKWLNGTLSASELEVLKQDEAFRDYLKIDSYLKRLDLPDGTASEGLIDIKQRLANRPKPKVFRLKPLLKFAAAAAVLILVGYFYITSLPSTFETQVAQTEILELPDRSKVTLNENSNLEFRKNTYLFINIVD